MLLMLRTSIAGSYLNLYDNTYNNTYIYSLYNPLTIRIIPIGSLCSIRDYSLYNNTYNNIYNNPCTISASSHISNY